MRTTGPPNLEANRTLRVFHDSNRRQASVELVQELFSGSLSDFKRRDVMYVWTLQKT